MSVRLDTLIAAARNNRNGIATAGNGWTATSDSNSVVTVRHYATDMFQVAGWNAVRPLNPGRGSHSDVAGTNKILAGIQPNGSHETYDSLFRS
jgi:hypothetical protein